MAAPSLLLLKPVSLPIHLPSGITSQITIKKKKKTSPKRSSSESPPPLSPAATMCKVTADVTSSQTTSSEDACECFALGSNDFLIFTVVFGSWRSRQKKGGLQSIYTNSSVVTVALTESLFYILSIQLGLESQFSQLLRLRQGSLLVFNDPFVFSLSVSQETQEFNLFSYFSVKK